MTKEGFDTSVVVHDGITIVSVSGELDIATVDAAGKRLEEAVPNSANAVVLDLTEVSFLDSAAISLLFDLHERLTLHQQELRIVSPASAPFADALRLVGLPEVIPLDDGLLDSLHALGADGHAGAGS
jgi:anti-anti-sigma factor